MIDKELNSHSMNDTLNVARLLNLDGKIIKSNRGNRRRKLTKKEIKQDAKDLAWNVPTEGRDYTAQDYLDGNLIISGSKPRTKLFEKTFNKEYKKALADKALSEVPQLLDEVIIDASSLTEDQKRAFANAFRNRNLTGHIGAGLDQNLGNKDLLKIAPAAIGPALGMANPVTGAIMEGMLSEAVNLGSKASPYVDKMVTPVKDWFLKDGLKWYDPRHVVRTVFNPKSAYTAGGQAAATALDLGGAYLSYDDLKNNVLIPLQQQYANQGYIDASTLPSLSGRAGMDLLGMMPIMSYTDDFAKIPSAVYSGISRLADDTVQSYRALRSGIEPVLGIRPNLGVPEPYNNQESLARLQELRSQLSANTRSVNDEQIIPFREFESSDHSSRFLPELSDGIYTGETIVSEPRVLAPRPEQYNNLSLDAVSQLNRIGLRRYDVQNLLDRGFSYEDMLRLTDTFTPGVTSNRRAQVLEQRLRDSGITPTLPTRLDYLQSVIDNGETLLEHRGVPYTFDEWNRLPETQDLDPLEHQWQGNLNWLRHTYYGQPRTTPRSIVEQVNPTLTPDENGALSMFESLDAFSDLRKKLHDNIEVFGEDEFKVVYPEIRRILIDGINSQKPVAQIESELDALYEQYDKPFVVDLSSIFRGGARAQIESPSTHDIRKALIAGIRPSSGNAPIRRNPYPSVSDIPYIIKPGEQVYSPSRFSIFNATANDVASMQRAAIARLPHGGITYDVHKSAQSMPMADRMYTRMIADGEGIGTFLPSGFNWDDHYGDGYKRVSQYLPNDGYFYRKSNGLEGTRWSPRNGVGDKYTPDINAQTAREILDENVGRFEEFLNVVDPRVFSEMGGYPKYGIEIDGRFYDLPIIKGVRPDGSKGLIIQQSDDVIKAVDDFDRANESILKTSDSWDDFKVKTQYLIESFHPDGMDAKLTQNKKGIWGISNKDGRFVSLSSFAKSNPDFERRYVPLVEELNNKLKGQHLTLDQRSAIMGDRVYIHGPVRAIRMRKHGGKIINNLNPIMKHLLNI